jgi:hypothetical protein
MYTLGEHVEAAMQISKDLIARGETLQPLIVLFKEGMPNLPIPLKLATDEDRDLSIRVVQTFILTFRPDFAVMVTEGWMLDVRMASKEEAKKFTENYERGDAEKSPNRMEVIMVDGAGIGQHYSAIQPYTRKGKKIIFQDRVVIPDGGYMDNSFFGNTWETLEGEGKVRH